MKRLPKFERQFVGARKAARVIGNILLAQAEHMSPGARASMQDVSDDDYACSLLELCGAGYLGIFRGINDDGEEAMALLPCLNGEPIVDIPYSYERIAFTVKNKPPADRAGGVLRMPRAAGPRSSVPTVNGARDED